MPEIAVEGELELPEDTLVLDSVEDVAALRQAYDQGRPVVVRAETADGVRTALARPEVSSVLVPPGRRDLLELDLTALTYD